jgi:hypothetical protein
VQLPGDTARVGRHRQRHRQGLPAEYRYDDELPADYWDPTARARGLDTLGVDSAVLFANFGLLWERRLSKSLPALTANMSAWNRWCATVVEEGRGQLHPAVFIWTPPALATTDLIVHGTLDRHPELRLGIVALGAVWVPMYLMMLDGGTEFATKLNGRPLCELELRPSEYFRRHVRVAALSYERPERLRARADGLFMCCSDYPHSEGSATPIDDYRATGVKPEEDAGLFHGNVAFLLHEA